MEYWLKMGLLQNLKIKSDHFKMIIKRSLKTDS